MSHLLIIEDNDSDITLLKYLVLQNNLTADVVKNPYDAEDKLNTNKYQLILLDWHLPQMSGIDYLTSLKLSKKNQNIPVIMISGRSDIKDIKTALKNGIADYIIKPIDPQIFQNKVFRNLNKTDIWKLTEIPDYIENNMGSLLYPFKLKALSEVEVIFSSSLKLNKNDDYSIQLELINVKDNIQIQIKILKFIQVNDSDQFIYTSKIIGAKEEVLTQIRLACRQIELLTLKNKIA